MRATFIIKKLKTYCRSKRKCVESTIQININRSNAFMKGSELKKKM